ncbi:hypothetical protein OXPF_21540 [Oxobacter pfennigii]|uniref:Rqc2 homolog RqcH n=1 Tax=Oxobacter pfennigii TaxID=36849 RepID=A0A0P8W7F9_9CLOT|nr:NFACT RNA binding domain-containing protein [Oxobacter pfennigii]KPU43989.1 hypothetical protein OXPF_21540 [Oxobacter pfennigii]
MPIDGVVVRNIVSELKNKLAGGRVEKITQPEVDEVNIYVRNGGENHRLLLSSSPNYPKVHLTDVNKQSPINAPLFCMVLRKHLSGGRIKDIEQYNLDRIIKIHIESYDELGSLSVKTIICEIMGRHSNIILINDKNQVIDSIKRITPDVSSFRQVLPGIQYKYPPMQDKLEPLMFDRDDFKDRIGNASDTVKISKFISNSINGFSILSSREICHNAQIDDGLSMGSLDEGSKERLINSTAQFINKVVSLSFTPAIYYSGSAVYDFYSFVLEHLKGFKHVENPGISFLIDQFYYDKDRSDRMRQKSSDITKLVNSNLERCHKKLAIQEEKLIECKEKDKWKLYGDLIMANMYTIKKGDSKADVVNFFSEDGSNIEIPLDMTLTPSENAQSYYKKYNKEKTAQVMVEKQKEENLIEIEYLENQLINIENCTEDDEIEEIRAELVSMGYIKKHRKNASKKTKQSKPLHYISSDGTDIYVGKNNMQNDYLTTKLADNNDIWMHTKNIPGSHVIIKTGSKNISDKSIIEAAALAAYFSKAKNSSNVPVDYTERKNVKKPSGSKPGMVIYYTNKTIYVTPDEELINSIKKAE